MRNAPETLRENARTELDADPCLVQAQQKRALEELGNVEETDTGSAWRARVQHRDAIGQLKQIHGPSRESRYLAEQDLNCMRLAGAVFKGDREQDLKAMFYEAHRIQAAAEHANVLPASQSDDEEELADLEKIVDPDEWRQELQSGAITMDELNKPEEQASLEDPTEALRCFRQGTAWKGCNRFLLFVQTPTS